MPGRLGVLKGIAICFVALMLAGCGAVLAEKQAEEAAKQRADQEANNADCRKQFPTAPRINHAALARCLNDVAARYWTDTANRDLLDLYAAKRLAISTQMDEGKVTEEEGQLAIAQAATDTTTAHQQRVNAENVVATQQGSADAAANPPPPTPPTFGR
jgi:hypothetical protein